MTNDNALIPVQQKQVLFYNDTITAVQLEDQTIYIPIRPLCDLLGLNWDGQRRRINRDPVLNEEVRAVVVTTTARSDGRPQTVPMLCLPLKFISGFLFGISVSRVKEELQPQLIRYQRECYEVLNEAFQDGRLTSDSVFDDLIANEASESVQAYKLIQAMLKLARQQIMLESQVSDHERRLADIEIQLGNPDHHITSQQASHLSQAVKAVAMALSKQTKRNEFGGVYGELYRRYEITSYKDLPAKSFESAMSFLSDWYQQITNEDIPF